MYNLITIGDIVIDTHVQIDDASLECKIKDRPCMLCLDYASKIPITDSFQSLGGNAANVAAGAVKLGLKTAIISSVGNDANGRLAVSELENLKVNTEHITIEDKNTTRYSIVLNFKGERTILSFHGKRKYSWPDPLPATDWIYYTGLSKGFEKIQARMLKHLQAHPTVRLAFNPGSYQLKSAMDKTKEVIAVADVLIVNLEEAEKIAGTTLRKVKKIDALIHQLLQTGVKEVVITDAERGAYVGNIEETWHMPTCPVKVVAKTGAGDAFSAGYVAARSQGYNRPQSLRWGIANSCGVITKVGAQKGLLNKNQILRMISKYADIVPKPIA